MLRQRQPQPPQTRGGGVGALFGERLRALEQKAVARETYWQGVVREVQRAHAADAAGLRMQCARAVEAKNVQIRHFREQLNGLIASMHEQQLRKSMSPAAPGVAGGVET